MERARKRPRRMAPPHPATRPPPEDYTAFLPDDVLAAVLARVPVLQLVHMSRVCRRWTELLREDWLWRMAHMAQHHSPAATTTSTAPRAWYELATGHAVAEGQWKSGAAVRETFQGALYHDGHVMGIWVHGDRVLTLAQDNKLVLWRRHADHVRKCAPLAVHAARGAYTAHVTQDGAVYAGVLGDDAPNTAMGMYRIADMEHGGDAGVPVEHVGAAEADMARFFPRPAPPVHIAECTTPRGGRMLLTLHVSGIVSVTPLRAGGRPDGAAWLAPPALFGGPVQALQVVQGTRVFLTLAHHDADEARLRTRGRAVHRLHMSAPMRAAHAELCELHADALLACMVRSRGGGSDAPSAVPRLAQPLSVPAAHFHVDTPAAHVATIVPHRREWVLRLVSLTTHRTVWSARTKAAPRQVWCGDGRVLLLDRAGLRVYGVGREGTRRRATLATQWMRVVRTGAAGTTSLGERHALRCFTVHGNELWLGCTTGRVTRLRFDRVAPRKRSGKAA